MKTIVKQSPPSNETFPKLMINTNHKYIVLFTDKFSGTVVSENVYCPVGYHSVSWAIEDFQDFKDSVTLSN